jgi:hypothetical protein
MFARLDLWSNTEAVTLTLARMAANANRGLPGLHRRAPSGVRFSSGTRRKRRHHRAADPIPHSALRTRALRPNFTSASQAILHRQRTRGTLQFATEAERYLLIPMNTAACFKSASTIRVPSRSDGRKRTRDPDSIKTLLPAQRLCGEFGPRFKQCQSGTSTGIAVTRPCALRFDYRRAPSLYDGCTPKSEVEILSCPIQIPLSRLLYWS